MCVGFALAFAEVKEVLTEAMKVLSVSHYALQRIKLNVHQRGSQKEEMARISASIARDEGKADGL